MVVERAEQMRQREFREGEWGGHSHNTDVLSMLSEFVRFTEASTEREREETDREKRQ